MIELVAALAVVSLLIVVHELGHFVVAKHLGLRVDEFALGYPPRLFTLFRVADTEYTLNLIPFGAYVRLPEEAEPHRLLNNRPAIQRAAFLLAGPFLNLLLALVLFTVCFATGWPEAHDLAVAVNKVLPGSVGEAVGFRDNDLILAVDDRPVSSVLELVVYARSVSGAVRSATLRREGRRITLRLPAGGAWFTKTESRGVDLRNGAGWVETVAYPLPQALIRGTGEAFSCVTSLLLLLVDILRGLIPVDLVRPVGPVGIAQLAGRATTEALASGWWFPLLQLTATLSGALAATNLLPLPGFDGGRLLFVLLEALRGKRISPRRESLVHLIGLILMLMLILIISYYDITRPIQVHR
ncbi:MAG TPA: M50 family metallopeptidase [Anaerolineae bacterium]|nr:M50 family metallopeptidase [Anaerolineae bacterium]HQJ51683.1 M50 family metallopeptidase [Anaerolineae bacterium]